MKKSFSVFFLTFLFLSTACIGQVSVGAKLGFNLATMTIDPGFTSLGKGPALGFHGGTVFNIGLSNMLSVQPEILFTQKGLKFSDNFISQTYTIQYFEFPVLLKFAFGNEEVKGFLIGGPFAGYSTSQKIVSRANDTLINKSKIPFDSDLEDDGYADNRLDLGLALGVGVQFKTGPGNIFAEVRYDISLNSVEKLKEVPAGYSLVKNKVVMISLGYLYTLNSN